MLLLIPCGLDTHQTRDEWRATRAARPEWVGDLAVVEAGRVFALNGSAYFSRPGPRVVDGIAILAELFDPGAFGDEVPVGSFIRLVPD